MPGATAHGYPYTADTDTMGTWPTTSQNAANKLESDLHAAWIVPALAGSWVIYSGATPVGYRNHAGETVVRGLIKNGAAGALFTLPAPYRPVQDSYFVVLATAGAALIAVYAATGIVTLINYISGGANSYLGLDPIRFQHV